MFCRGAGIVFTKYDEVICGSPDGMFLSNADFRANRIRMTSPEKTGYAEVFGAPEMALEVVSKTSRKKDRTILRAAYWRAGIREFWLVDAHKQPPVLDILRHPAKGYAASR